MAGATNRSRRWRPRIAVVTGTRAEFGLLESTLRALRASEAVELQIVAAGMHLLPKFGDTAADIRRAGWPVAARVRMQAGDDHPLDQALGLSRGVAGIARFLHRARTDLVLVLGDRIEALAAALAAVTTGCTLAHVHGGDVAPGDFDEPIRDAITKLADLHFTATRQAARRVIRMGENPARVFQVGAPGLDRIYELLGESPPPSAIAPFAMVIYHAWGRPASVERRIAAAILDAVAGTGLRRCVVYPNSDRGHEGVIRAIEQHQRHHPAEVEVFRSLPRDAYLHKLLAAEVLVGNSSSGIIEAPAAGTPSVNVGGRQAGRERGGPSVLDASESQESVAAALKAALRKRPARRKRLAARRTVYGDGGAGARIAEHLVRMMHAAL